MIVASFGWLLFGIAMFVIIGFLRSPTEIDLTQMSVEWRLQQQRIRDIR